MAATKKTLYHGELRGLGPVEVAVLSDIMESTKKKGSYYITLRLAGEERYYNPENDNCMSFFNGLKGSTLTIEATGTREEAELIAHGDPIQTPGTAQRPAPSPKPAPARPQPAQPQRQAQPQSTQPPTQPQRQPAPAAKKYSHEPVMGQLVGMCMKEAVGIVSAIGVDPFTPDFYRHVHEISSDLIRVSITLQDGNLAPMVKERIKAKAGVK